jgi:heat shock protein HtpX
LYKYEVKPLDFYGLHFICSFLFLISRNLATMKRILLFLATNIAVMVVLAIVTQIFHIDPKTSSGLVVFSAVIGFTGSIFSLLMSKQIAKWSTPGFRTIEQAQTADEAWIVETVRRFAEKAGIGMPEVGIYEGDPNAFATGASRNNALVAVSTGLMRAMNRDEVEAVIGHEIAHIANGDMVTLTLVQGVVNTFVVYLSRVAGAFLGGRDANGNSTGSNFLVTLVLQVVLGFLASMIVAWFSRQREYRADAGSSQYMGSSRKMQAALARLGGVEAGELPQSMQAMGIAGGLTGLFSSHPPLEDRIARLKASGI